MAIKDALLPEFDHEMATTRRVLERVPEDRADWKPHEKSMSLGRLAGHVAEIPGYAIATLTSDGFDIAAGGYKPSEFTSREQALADFDQKVAQARAALEATSDEAFARTWTFRNGETVVFATPKAGAYRSVAMNHLIHHRGQLTVYLRLLGVPLPSVYGPSADEQRFG
jgi:uncharacterized damage-inducible protein DinB